VKLAILWLSVGVKITLDMKQIKICIDIMLSNYLASLDDIARILDVNEYAKQHKNAAKAIEEIRQILITKLLPYMPDVLCVIIIGYLY
jgi:protein associated with RNAse G/E